MPWSKWDSVASQKVIEGSFRTIRFRTPGTIATHWLRGKGQGRTYRAGWRFGGTILTSPDGVAWTLRKEGPSWEALQGVAASPTRIVVTSASFGAVYTSPNGVTWTQNPTASPQALLDIVWSSSKFVAVGYAGTINKH